jgi:hypothetical protein
VAEFDWYAATLNQPEMSVKGHLLHAMGGTLVPGRGEHGYREGAKIERDGETLLTVLWGGNGETVHVYASGSVTPQGVRVIRAVYPDHAVTRLDVASDHDHAGAWRRMYAALVRYAKLRNLRTMLYGDYIGGLSGRTLYVGSRSSAGFVRLYEKGKQLREQGVRMDASLDWVRFEAAIRPQREQREIAARMEAREAIGLSRTCREAYEVIGMGATEKRGLSGARRTSDDEAAISAMVRQYGGILTREAGVQGGWSLLGKRLGLAVEHGAYDRDRIDAELYGLPGEA